MIKDELAAAIALQLPKLTKRQLSEILLLANAWANGIPLVNLKIQPKSTQELHQELEKEKWNNTHLGEEIDNLRQKVTEYEEYTQHLSKTIKTVLQENRWLRSDRFLQPKEAPKL